MEVKTRESCILMRKIYKGKIHLYFSVETKHLFQEVRTGTCYGYENKTGVVGIFGNFSR